MIRLACAAATILLLLTAAGCGNSHHVQAQQRSTPAEANSNANTRGARQLTDLRDIGQLRSLFNTRSGEPRLILLASPT